MNEASIEFGAGGLKADMEDVKLNVIKGFRYKKSKISYGCLSSTLPRVYGSVDKAT